MRLSPNAEVLDRRRRAYIDRLRRDHPDVGEQVRGAEKQMKNATTFDELTFACVAYAKGKLNIEIRRMIALNQIANAQRELDMLHGLLIGCRASDMQKLNALKKRYRIARKRA